MFSGHGGDDGDQQVPGEGEGEGEGGGEGEVSQLLSQEKEGQGPVSQPQEERRERQDTGKISALSLNVKLRPFPLQKFLLNPAESTNRRVSRRKSETVIISPAEREPAREVRRREEEERREGRREERREEKRDRRREEGERRLSVPSLRVEGALSCTNRLTLGENFLKVVMTSITPLSSRLTSRDVFLFTTTKIWLFHNKFVLKAFAL